MEVPGSRADIALLHPDSAARSRLHALLRLVAGRDAAVGVGPASAGRVAGRHVGDDGGRRQQLRRDALASREDVLRRVRVAGRRHSIRPKESHSNARIRTSDQVVQIRNNAGLDERRRSLDSQCSRTRLSA